MKFAAVLGVLVAALGGRPGEGDRDEFGGRSTLHVGVDLSAVGQFDDRVLRLCLPSPRDPGFHRRRSPGADEIMAAGRASAAAERAAVQKVVVWFDRRMGPILGTTRRVAKADFRYFDDKHNYDCWDTTRNTTSLLLVLREWGLLKHHAIGDPHYRGNTLVLQTPHNTAVLVERATKVEWVVDLWPRGYLQPPDVMTVQKWVKED